jgi:hypothetical protein
MPRLGWGRDLAAAGVVVASGVGPPALAQSGRAGFGWDVGIHVGYHFGGGAPRRTAFGIETRALYGHLIPTCGENTVHPLGGVIARIGFVGRDFRLVTGAHGGLRRGWLGTTGELGVGFDLAEAGGVFLQPGLEVSAFQSFSLRAHHAVGRDTSLSFGIRGGTASVPVCGSGG